MKDTGCAFTEGGDGCSQPSRMAISTHRPNRTKIYSRVFYDDRTAPASALRYCRLHGVQILGELADVLTEEDPPVVTQ
jgi:hypothetical protein